MFNKYSTDYGLLIIRLGIGSLFIYFGFLKLTGGVSMWEGIGKTMSNVHINFFPVFWGLMASLSEFVGGLCLILGFFFRPALAFMLFTMCMALFMFHTQHSPFKDYVSALLSAIVFLGLFFSGPGKYALKISKR